jgi:hypothetical protein
MTRTSNFLIIKLDAAWFHDFFWHGNVYTSPQKWLPNFLANQFFWLCQTLAWLLLAEKPRHSIIWILAGLILREQKNE